MAVDTARAKSLFLFASELADLAERAAYLDRECGDDVPLRQQVDRLLRANDDAPFPAGDRLAATIDSAGGIPATHDYADSTARVGSLLAGKYKLVEEIGSGGMGSVYLAQQTEPVKRAVAVKVVKAGMDSRAVLARFDAERQALALMDHPNIAKVLDAGTTDGGRPFFVMELVRGTPITEFCDERKLTPRKRLELFVPVCQAIQHAHQKGIIHRDIKPSNVLVAMYDDRAVPKVIDFGVAKATGAVLTEMSLMTGFGAVVGTPEYMSPEQAQLNNLDVDSRSDVYSLGVLLYQLLTGTTPMDRKSLGQAALLEILRIVREVEAPRPSSKLSTIDTLPSVAANRSTEPAKLSRLLAGELDWVLLKALEKDRTRRYDTANALARDIQRYLADEIVEARPPSAGYRLQKFARKNRTALTLAAAIAALLVAGIAGTTWGLVQARQSAAAERIAKNEADARRLDAEAQKARAMAGEKEAQQEKQIAQAVKDFLQKKLLGQADAETQADALLEAGRLAAEVQQNPTIRELLDRAASELAPGKIEESFPNQPLVQAEILETVGNTYRGVGEAERAIEFLKRCLDLRTRHLGVEHTETLKCQNNLGIAYLSIRKFAGALPLLEQTLERRREILGPTHDDTLESMNNLGAAYLDAGKLKQALTMFQETLERRLAINGENNRDTLTTMHNLAFVYQEVGQLKRALPLFEQAFELEKRTLGVDHPSTLTCLGNLGKAHLAAGKMGDAVAMLEEAYERKKAKYGDGHPAVLRSVNNLILAYRHSGKLDQALAMLEEQLDRVTEKFGEDAPTTTIFLANLGDAYVQAGKPDVGQPMIERALQMSRVAFGADHPVTLQIMVGLVQAHVSRGQWDATLPLAEETFRQAKEKLGSDNPITLVAMADLALTYKNTGRQQQALPMLEELWRIRRGMLGPEHPQSLQTMQHLGVAYWNAKQLDKSIPLFEEALRLHEANLGPQHTETIRTRANLGVNYLDAGRIQEALLQLERAHQAAQVDPAFRWLSVKLYEAYFRAEKYEQAAVLTDEVLAKARRELPADSVQLAGVLAMCGGTLLKANQCVEAEAILRECLAIREKTQPDQWSTFNAQSMLGGALLGQQKCDEAAALLLSGLAGLKQREETIPPPGASCIPQALDRLIRLYTTIDKPDQVEKWKAERVKYPASSGDRAAGN